MHPPPEVNLTPRLKKDKRKGYCECTPGAKTSHCVYLISSHSAMMVLNIEALLSLVIHVSPMYYTSQVWILEWNGLLVQCVC